jgi:hypothetical protein
VANEKMSVPAATLRAVRSFYDASANIARMG